MKNVFMFLLLVLGFGFSQEFNFGANVRDGFEKGSEIIDTVPKNVVITVSETNSIILFAEVLDGTKAGKKGYVASKLLTNNVVGGQGCRFRSSYQKDSEIIFVVPAGAKVKVLKGYYNWYRVSYTNNGVLVDGWISEENVKK